MAKSLSSVAAAAAVQSVIAPSVEDVSTIEVVQLEALVRTAFSLTPLLHHSCSFFFFFLYAPDRVQDCQELP